MWKIWWIIPLYKVMVARVYCYTSMTKKIFSLKSLFEMGYSTMNAITIYKNTSQALYTAPWPALLRERNFEEMMRITRIPRTIKFRIEICNLSTQWKKRVAGKKRIARPLHIEYLCMIFSCWKFQSKSLNSSYFR